MEYDYSCCYYCPHLHKNREWSLLLFCLVSCGFFVMAALKIRIAVWWEMIPCSASAVVSVSLGCRFREESRRAVTKQGFLPILPVLGLSDSRAELLNMDMVNDCSFKGGCCLALTWTRQGHQRRKKIQLCALAGGLRVEVAFIGISVKSRSSSSSFLVQDFPAGAAREGWEVLHRDFPDGSSISCFFLAEFGFLVMC